MNVIASNFQIALTLEIITAQLLDTSWSIPNHDLEETKLLKAFSNHQRVKENYDPTHQPFSWVEPQLNSLSKSLNFLKLAVCVRT